MILLLISGFDKRYRKKPDFMGGGTNYPSGVIPIKNQGTYVINMKSGKIILLNKTSLKKILKDDPDLLQRFKKADKKKSKLMKYLKEYIRRNASK